MSKWTTFRDSIINRLLAIFGLQLTDVSETKSNASETNQCDEVDFGLLQWSWGGFNGAGAILNESCSIANLHINKQNMTYSWVNGSCQALAAASDASDASKTLACLFVLNDGNWQGGKFDWISTNRTSRSFENIHCGYKGWDAKAFSQAEAYAFVIVSADGKHRTNAIVRS